LGCISLDKRRFTAGIALDAPVRRWATRALSAAVVAGLLFAVVQDGPHAADAPRVRNWQASSWGAGATFCAWSSRSCWRDFGPSPSEFIIGLRPRLSAIAQPIAQIAASVPATALFPIVLLFLIRIGGGLGLGSIVLLLLGTQWYILFNVIAGASAIPTDLKEVCDIFGINKFERWRKLLLPAIFPYLVTGFVTASGGAWNASIVAEYVHFKDGLCPPPGLGAVISRATDSGNLPFC
jgi:NitT/TauT family transport system permease protein